MDNFDAADDEIRRQFAQEVKRYRKNVFGWTQQKLAEEAQLLLRTVQDIETAEKKVLDLEILEKLATAFKLEGAVRDAFYASAGRSVPPAPMLPVQLEIVAQNFFRDLKYPALISDIFCDIHYINSYLLAILGLDLSKLPPLLLKDTLGANYFKFFFSPSFGTKGLYRVGWRDYIRDNIFLFREATRSYQHEPRYSEVLQEAQVFEDFISLWNEINQEPPLAVENLPMPHTTLYSPKYHELTYRHAEFVMPKSLQERFHAIFYLPTDDGTRQAFNAIVENEPLQVYRFNRDARNGYEIVK